MILNNKEILKQLLNFLTIVLKRFTIQRCLDVVKPFEAFYSFSLSVAVGRG